MPVWGELVLAFVAGWFAALLAVTLAVRYLSRRPQLLLRWATQHMVRTGNLSTMGNAAKVTINAAE